MRKQAKEIALCLCLLIDGAAAFAAPILLKTGEIDPSGVRPKLMAMASQPVPARGLYLMQHDGVTPLEWREHGARCLTLRAKFLHTTTR